MKISRKKALIISIVTLTFLCVSIFVIVKKTQADQPLPSVSVGIERLQSYLDTQPRQKKDILINFCEATKNTTNGFTDGSLHYTPQYSLFLGILCKPLGVDVFFNDTYIAPAFKKNWQSLSPSLQFCDPSTNMKYCDIPVLLKTIFTAVMDDHSTLGMGGWAMSSNKPDEIIKGFSNTYFSGSVCDGKSSYVGKKGIQGAEACIHPQTYTYIENIINNFQQQKKKIQTIDIKNISNITKDSNCKENKDYPNLFLCSYTSTFPENKTSLQVNLRYNELMYYRILSKWLILRYSNDTTGLGSVDLAKLQNDGSPNTIASHKNEILSLQYELNQSKEAVTIMQRIVANFQTTFPLHVGLLAYYEDITAIRKSFVKIYTPLNQLYYTLRNVQTK